MHKNRGAPQNRQWQFISGTVNQAARMLYLKIVYQTWLCACSDTLSAFSS